MSLCSVASKDYIRTVGNLLKENKASIYRFSILPYILKNTFCSYSDQDDVKTYMYIPIQASQCYKCPFEQAVKKFRCNSKIENL